jgi:hypothetical protein
MSALIQNDNISSSSVAMLPSDAQPSQVEETAESLKQQANDYFIAKDYAMAETLYTKALDYPFTTTDLRVMLYTNRSAARISLNKLDEAIADADEAINLDCHWVKAYFRKASALEALNRPQQVFATWVEAAVNCENNQVLVKQFKAAQDKWRKLFRKPEFLITSVEDLLRRYQLFSDKRERLSTLAHFWNDSSSEERLSFLLLLLKIISGAGALSDASLEVLTPEMMVDMPLQNYNDLPRSRLSNWFDFFKELPSEEKQIVFRSIWDHLNAEEKNDIITDMKALFGPAESTTDDLVDNADE